MTMVDIGTNIDMSRAARLRTATRDAHERLDECIMAANPFANRGRYSLLVVMQHQFHLEIDALYGKPVLAELLPDLSTRRRLRLIQRDLSNLGIVPALVSSSPVFVGGEEVDVPAALGWLYVAEGSNLGAAFLLKEAMKLGLSEIFGARHLAGAPEGRGLHWKMFTAALDSVSLTQSEEERAISGAREAFACVRKLVDVFLHSGPNVIRMHDAEKAL